MAMMDKRTESAFWILKLTFGLVPVVAGLDKFTHLLTDWNAYLSPVLAGLLPVGAGTFMKLVGVIEVVAGLLVLSPRTTRLGAYVVAAWLVGIALNLVTTGHYLDIAVRDLVMAVASFSLAKLAEARQASAAPVGRPVQRTPAHA
jgi:uncharacterized membrane protein YphA (DoxX/SURF4 family)